MTLPLIYTLNKVDSSTRKQIINVIKNDNQNMEKVQWVISNVRSNGGMDYAVKRMMEYRDEALKILHTFPASEARTSIEQLIEYTISRKL